MTDSPTPASTVSTSRSTDGVLRLTLDRPDKRNAIDDAMMRGPDRRGRRAPATDERVRVILLDGAGEHFCGGADIVARNAPAATRRSRAPAASSAGCRRRRTA